MLDMDHPIKQEKLVSNLEKIIAQTNSSVLTSLVFDSPQMEWWISINANRFLFVFVALTVAGTGNWCLVVRFIVHE